MSDSLVHRGGTKLLGGAGVRQEVIDIQSGERYAFLRRHRRECTNAAAGDSEARSRIAAELFLHATDSRNIMCAADHLVQFGGTAPGPNALVLKDLDAEERWEMARELAKAIRRGWYRPGPERRVKRPKGANRGYRTLTIQNVEDRVVQRAILQAIEPIIDPQFLNTSMGYRPRVGWFHALALAEATMLQEGQRRAIIEDLRDAFDTVPLGRLMDLVRKYVPNEELATLIEKVIARDGSRKGIRQGGSLSPLLLNLYLHHFLDRVWKRRVPEARLIRVADDLLVLCQDRRQVLEAYQKLQSVLEPTGMILKGNEASSVCDMRKDDAEWLGLSLRWGKDRLVARMSQRKYERLEQNLSDAHSSACPARTVQQSVLMWAEQLGPCFRTLSPRKLHESVRRIAERQGFLEIPTRDDVWSHVRKGHDRWCDIRRDAFRTSRTAFAQGSADAPRRNRSDVRLISGASRDAQHNTVQHRPLVVLTTDGSCLIDGQPSVGGWAFLLHEVGRGKPIEESGAAPRTTNNRMELTAAIRGFEAINSPSRVRLVTDSQYVGLGIVEWLPRWKVNGWRRGRAGRTARPKNLDLWQHLDRVMAPHDVQVEWVRGHSDNPRNERCDQLACAAAMALATGYDSRLGRRRC